MIKLKLKETCKYRNQSKTKLCDELYFLIASIKKNERAESIFYISSSYDAMLNKLRTIYRRSVSDKMGGINVKNMDDSSEKTEKFLTDCHSDYETEIFFKELKKQHPIVYIKNKRYIDFWDNIKPLVKRGERITGGEIRMGNIVRMYSSAIAGENEPNIGVDIFFDLDNYAEFIENRFGNYLGFDEDEFFSVCDDESATREDFYSVVENLKYE